MSAVLNLTPAYTGWTFYTPLSITYQSSINLDFLLLFVIVLSLIIISFIAVVFVSIDQEDVVDSKRPVVSTVVVGAWMALLLFPVLMIINMMLVMDRILGSAFFQEPTGDSIVFQTGFWIFGHPEVYLLTLPVIGILVSLSVLNRNVGSIHYTKHGQIGILVSRVAILS